MTPPRQFSHILGKDLRGHALEVGALLLLNGILAWSATETWAEGISPSASTIESLASALLVVTWCLLIARVVQAESPAGRTAYWLTRPYARPVLLASKLTFVLLCVHLPGFLAQLLIVTGSGVPYSVPHLLLDQLFLAIFVSLPAALIASLTTSLNRFAIAAIAVAAITAMISGDVIEVFGIYPDGTTTFMGTGVLASIALITGAALIWQYFLRSTRSVTIASLVAASLLGATVLWVPLSVIERARGVIMARTVAEPTIVLRSAANPRLDQLAGPDTASRVWLPLDIPGDDTTGIIRHVEIYLRTPDGNEVEAGGSLRWGTEHWVSFTMPPALGDSLNDTPVTLRIILEVELFEERVTEPIPVDGSAAVIDGVAQCGTINRGTLACRTSSGASRWFVESGRVLQLRYPVALRFSLNPIRTARLNSSVLSGRLAAPPMPTSTRVPSRYERQVVVLEDVRLADWRAQ